METITREYTVYNYSELSEKAKEKVREWYIDDYDRCYTLSDCWNDYLEYNFKRSDLKVEWSLNYCQGDGVNAYGKLKLSDMMDKIDYESYTPKEIRFIEWVIREYDPEITLPQNNHYAYCMADRIDIESDLLWDMKNDGIKNIRRDTLEKLNDDIIAYFENLCSQWETSGYEYLYEPDEEEIIEACEANDWKFTEEGKFFY